MIDYKAKKLTTKVERVIEDVTHRVKSWWVGRQVARIFVKMSEYPIIPDNSEVGAALLKKLKTQDPELSKKVNQMLFGSVNPNKKMKGFRVVVVYEDGTEDVAFAKTGFHYITCEGEKGYHQVSFISPDSPIA